LTKKGRICPAFGPKKSSEKFLIFFKKAVDKWNTMCIIISVRYGT